MKKTLKVVLAVLFLISMFTVFQASAFSDVYDHQKPEGYIRRPYAQTEEIKIIDHVVYYKEKDHYIVIDFFDTDSYAEKSVKLSIVDKIDNIPVTQIRNRNVEECDVADGYESSDIFYVPGGENVKEIKLPNTLEYIGPFAFQCFSSVKNLEIPQSVREIDVEAFSFMSKLEKINLPSGIDKISYGLFMKCENLKTVKVEGKVTSIDSYAFYECKALKKFDIPETVTCVHSRAFQDSGLTSVKIPKACKTIARESFRGSPNLKTVVIPSGSTVGARSFQSCHNLKSVTFTGENKNIKINQQAFQDCPSLKSVAFPQKVKNMKICLYAFEKCSSLKKLTLPEISGEFDVTYDFAPKTVSIYVKSVEEKNIIKYYRFKGKVAVRVNVPAVKYILPTETSNSITINWNKVKGATGYRVYLYNEKTEAYEKVVTTSKTKYTIKNLKAAKKYSFAVKAYKKIDGDNSWSEMLTNTTLTKPTKAKFKATASGKKVTFNITKQPRVNGYQIYYKAGKNGEYKKLTTIRGTNTASVSLKPGKTYYFKVRAFKTFGKTTNYFGVFSNEATVKTKG